MSQDPYFRAATEPEGETRPLPSYITWTAADVFLGIMAVVAIVFVISIGIVGTVTAAYGEDTPEAYFAAAVAALLWDAGFAVVAYAFVQRRGGDWRNLGLRPPTFVARSLFTSVVNAVPLPKLGVAIVAGYVLCYVSVMVYGIIVQLTGADFLEPSEQLPSSLFDNTIVVIATGIAVVFGAPIAEEILFRGFLFGGMRRYMSFLPAALLSGILFSLAHFNVGLVIPFTLIGAVLAYVYERTGSLYTAMGVHLLFNLTSFAFLVFFPGLR